MRKVYRTVRNAYIMVRWHIDLRTINADDFGTPEAPVMAVAK
jgi:hypothetical protein